MFYILIFIFQLNIFGFDGAYLDCTYYDKESNKHQAGFTFLVPFKTNFVKKRIEIPIDNQHYYYTFEIKNYYDGQPQRKSDTVLDSQGQADKIVYYESTNDKKLVVTSYPDKDLNSPLSKIKTFYFNSNPEYYYKNNEYFIFSYFKCIFKKIEALPALDY